MKKFFKFILIFLGIILVLNSTIMVFKVNFNIGIIATFLIGVFYIFSGVFTEKIHLYTASGSFKILKYLVISTNTILYALIIFLYIFGKYDTVNYKEDVVIILGAGVKGQRITSALKNRLDKGIYFHKKNPHALIIVSGGKGSGEDITEALAMEKYLYSKGIPLNKIIKEDKSANTFENFKFSKKILEKRFKNNYTLAFITNDFHIFRASKISAISGLKCSHLHAQLLWYTIPVTYIRESIGIIKLIVFNQ